MRGKDNYSILAKGASLNLVGSIIRIILLFSYALIISRLGGAEAFGIYSLGLVFVNVCAVFTEVGLGKAIIRYVGSVETVGLIKKGNFKTENELQVALILGLITSLTVTFILFILSDKIAIYIFKNAQLMPTLRFFVLSIPLVVVFNILISFTQALKTMRYKFYFRDLLQPLIELIVATTFFSIGLGTTGLAISFMGSYCFVVILLIIFVSRLVNLCFINFDFKKHAKKILGFSIHIMGGDLLVYLLPRISTFIIAIILSWNMVGVYSIVLRITMIQGLIITSFNLIFAPVISELYTKGDIKQLQILLKEITIWITLLCAPLLGVCVLFPSFILSLFGDDFVMGSSTLILLTIGQLVNVLTGPVMYTLIMIGRSKEYLIITFGTLLSCAILGAILTPLFGLFGAAFADMFTRVIMNAVMLFIVYKLLNIHPYDKKILSIIISLVFSGFLATVFSKQEVFQINILNDVVGILLFMLVYFIMTFKRGLYGKLFSSLMSARS